MGTSLTGTKPKDTYDSLIKVGDNGPISGTAKTLSDGLGNDLPIAVSTSNVGVGTSTLTRKFNIDGGSITSDTPTLRISSTDGSGTRKFGIEFFSNSGADVRGKLLADNNGRVYLDDNGGGGVVLQANGGFGNVGIKTASPAVPLDVVGNIRSSTGILFGSDTAAANLLDDYEEGIWTPTISFGGASTGVTYAAGRAGQYTKIGRQVTVTAFILLTSKGSSTGAARIGGLPLTIGNTSGYYAAGSLGALSEITYGGQIQSYGEVGSTSFRLNDYSEAGVQGDITDADFTNVSQILFTATYYV